MGEIAHAGAAELRVGGDAEQAERAEFLPEMGGKLVRAIDLGGERRDLFLREAADHVAQAVDLLAVAEIKRVQVHELPPCCADEPHRHSEIGLRDILHREPLVRAGTRR